MTIDKILSSVDASRPDLDATVKQFREMGAAMELVLADHFDVEDLATGVEQLAARLANIRDVLASHLGSVGAAGDLARTIDAIALPAGEEPAIALVEAGFTGDQDYTFSITERRLYGHPDLRHVFRYGLDPVACSRTHTDYLVHLPSGTVFEAPKTDTVFAAADTFKSQLIRDRK
ncbi:hypothetical protein [Pseudarthrobacter sp. PH31-O2]|uniref:hypothetical protein n=1 Tax=Pseudarthrobacter sp. PH31-O2 TaxID=3046206 RepID=UPI0024B8B730|nr:hypothetical protein [Pseudarthrobacter sp. PH31-O2]MDJ0354465.1 hypothetical protein [Pseudarthrobacter sp. PH31-O2]